MARRSPHEVLSVLEVDLQYLEGGGGVVEEEFRLIKKKYHKVSLDPYCVKFLTVFFVSMGDF